MQFRKVVTSSVVPPNSTSFIANISDGLML